MLSRFKQGNIIVLVFFIFLLIFLGTYIAYKKFSGHKYPPDDVEITESEQKKPEQEEFDMSQRSCLSGKLKLSDENYPVIAVIIDNLIDARPQSGLDKADLVIEAPVESQITRYLAFFDLNTVLKIDQLGPVRSARPYFLDWLSPYQAMFMHVGGSPEALSLIKPYDINDLDQFFWYKYYWRSSQRYAPHNVYTSKEMMTEALKDRSFEADVYQCWKYRPETETDKENVTIPEIVVDYGSPYHNLSWKYDLEDNYYLRYVNGKEYKTDDYVQITAKNIAVIETDITTIDSYGRKKITTVGEGKVYVFNQGGVIEGKWRKDSRQAILNFFDDHDKEIAFIPGTTWIEVVGDMAQLEYEEESNS